MLFVATKPLKYGTRRLQAGDEFEAPRQHGQVLIAVKKAKKAQEKKVEPPPPEFAAKMDEEADREALRELAAGMGVDVDRRWGAERLREAIERAREPVAPPEQVEPEPADPKPHKRRSARASEPHDAAEDSETDG